MNLLTQLKKVLATSATVAIVAMTLVVSPSARAFNDVAADAWFAPYVEALTTAGVFKAQDNFRPADNMNRAEFVKTLVGAAKVSTEGAADAGFSDVSSSDWFAPYVNAAVAAGIVNGSDKSATFRPTDNVTRAEAVKIALNAFGIDAAAYAEPKAAFSDDDGHWAEDMISAAYNLSIVDGQGGSKTAFAPNESISRSAVAKIASYAVIVSADPASYVRFDDGASAFSVFEPSEVVSQVTSVLGVAEQTTEEGTTTEGTTTTEETTSGTEVVASDGTLEVSLSADSPASVTLPQGASAVEFAKVDLTANGDDVVLTSMAFNRFGVGTTSDITALFLYDEATRLSSAVSVATYDNMAKFDNLNVTVKAGETKTITLRGDISSTATSGQHGFQLVAATGVGSNAQSISGDFPIKGNVMSTNTTSAGTMTIDYAALSTTSVAVGTSSAQVARFKVQAPSDQDIEVKQITLTNGGNVDNAALSNFVLKQNGETLAETASMTSVRGDDLVTFNLNTPFFIQKGNSRIFEAYADIVSGRAAETINFYLQNSGDILAKGKTFGFNVGTNAAASTFDVTNATYTVTLKAGKLTITFNGPAATDVVSGGNDVVLGEYSLTSGGNDLEIKGMEFNLNVAGSAKTASSTVSGLTNVRLVDSTTKDTLLSDNTSFINAANANFNGDFTLNFQEGIFTLRAGKTMKVAVVANIPSTTTAGALTLSLSKPETTWNYVKDLVTGKRFATTADWNEVVPNTALAANVQTIGAAGLTVTYGTSITAATVVRGGEGIKVAEFAFKANRGSDLNIRSVQLTGALGNPDNASTLKDAVTSIALYDGDKLVGTARSFDSANIATIDGMNFIVPSGTTKALTAKVNLSKNVTPFKSNGTTYVEVGMTDVVADDSNGNTVTGAALVITAVSTVANGPNLSVKQSGTLTAALDSSSRVNSVLVFGASKEEIASFRFQNVDETFKVTDLAFSIAGGAATKVSNLYLFAGGQPVKTDGGADAAATVSSDGTASFSNLGLMVNGATILTVKADVAALNASDNTGVVNTFTLSLDKDQTNRAYGQGSSQLLTAASIIGGSDIAANAMTTRATTVTVSFGAVTASSGTGKTVAQLTVANSANTESADAELTTLKMALTHDFSGVAPGAAGTGTVKNFKIYKSGNASVTVADSSTAANTHVATTTVVSFDLSAYADRFVTPGSSNVYYITADIAPDTDTQSTQKLQLSMDITGGVTTGLTWKDGRVVSGKYTPSASNFIYMPSQPGTISAPQLTY